MTHKSLFDSFISEDNFLSAYKRVAAKNAAGGVDGISIETFGKQLTKNIAQLCEQVRTGKYIPHPVKATHIPKFNEKKEWRELGLPAVADKIVQAALLQVVEPLAEKIFSDTSYGYRHGKGHYKAIRRVEHNLTNQRRKWAVRRDIDNFFDTLTHDKLLAAFSDLVKGETFLVELVALWLRMGLVEKSGRWRNVEAGVRQGHIISPLLANLYLHPLDLFASGFNAGWVRYADDYLIQCNSREEAERFDAEIITYLNKELLLNVNHDEHPVSDIENGFTFLGVSFKGEKRSIAPEKMGKIQRKISWLLSEKNRETPEIVMIKLSRKIDGLKRYYGFLNPIEQFSEIDAMVEKEFVACAAKRIRRGEWKNEPPEGIAFPLLINHGDGSDISKRIKILWSEALKAGMPVSLESTKQAADKKISKRRRQYRRDASLFNDLMVLTPGHFVGKRSERVIVRKDRQIITEMPALKLTGLTISARGNSISGDVIELCMGKDITVNILNGLGKIIAFIGPPGGVEGEISMLQSKEHSGELGLYLAKMFILGKVKNQFALLKYYYKYRVNHENGFGEVFRERESDMKNLITNIKNLSAHHTPEFYRQQLMGMEGAFANHYWSHIRKLFQNGIAFEGRVREGAKDMVNSSLNYGYGILYGRVANAAIRARLNPMSGFLHSFQTGKPVLVYDLIEEFRSSVVDRSIFTMLRRGEKIAVEEDGMLNQESRKKIAHAIICRLGSEIFWIGRRVTLDDVIKMQAMNIKNHLLRKSVYKPFLAKW